MIRCRSARRKVRRIEKAPPAYPTAAVDGGVEADPELVLAARCLGERGGWQQELVAEELVGRDAEAVAVEGDLSAHLDPIQHQHVEMRIEIQCAAEALDKGHRAALDGGVALCSSLLAIPGLNGAEKQKEKAQPPIKQRVALLIIGGGGGN